ncbi:MAG: hypothetical protein ACE5HD_06950 [Acidobacteriota bacterium]
MDEDKTIQGGSGGEPETASAPSDDADWRKTELEKMMFGEEKEKSPLARMVLVVLVLGGLGALGWLFFAPGSQPTKPVAETALPVAAPRPAPRLAPPPPPPPPPKPYKDLFEVQVVADGQTYIVYTIQPNDTLFKIGEKLHDVTAAPRMITHQAVQDAYWKKYFSYEHPNVDILSDAAVAERVGDSIKIPVPLDEYPDFDLAGEVEAYNQS